MVIYIDIPGELINIEIIDSLDQEAQKQCDLLAFLSHYRSFHEEYAVGDITV
jgi:hypothetical protein